MELVKAPLKDLACRESSVMVAIIQFQLDGTEQQKHKSAYAMSMQSGVLLPQWFESGQATSCQVLVKELKKGGQGYTLAGEWVSSCPFLF